MTLAELAGRIGARLHGDSAALLNGVNTVECATPEEVTFVTTQAHTDGVRQSKAGAVIVAESRTDVPMPQLVVDCVDRALIETLKLFAPKLKPLAGIHPSAVIEDTADIAPDAAVGPGAYVGPGVRIGSNSSIGPGCMIGENTSIGSHCRLDANVVVYHGCRIGDYFIIQANTTIGSTGFGYVWVDGRHELIPHNGGVVIQDCVEIGANCCIDRAKFNDTIIGAGTKLDNLIQIGHNVIIGKCCILAGQVGISGSCVIGDGVVMAGQVGIADHITIHDGVQIGAQSGVTRNAPPGIGMLGTPAHEVNQQRRVIAMMGRLPEWAGRLRALAARVDKIEKKLSGE